MSAPLVGKPIDRVDAIAKVTGRAQFSGDVKLANVAHAVIVSATISKGRATVDASRARAAPGVLAVVTSENAPRLPHASGKANENGRVLQALQDDHVVYDGQPIALVVAESLEAARHAASLLAIRYDREPGRYRIETADAAPYEPAPMHGRPPWDSKRGDADAALRSAAVRVEQTYTTPLENHNPMETHTTAAAWNGDRLTIYDSTQGIFGVRRRLAGVFEIPEDHVRVVSHFCGGGFGSKGAPWSHVVLAAMAARVARRPVKLVVTRHQMFAFVGHRPRTIQRVSLGASHDGKLVAATHDLLSHTSRFDEFTEPSALVTRMLYACPNVRTSHRLVRLDLSTPTYMRAPGEATGSFALESAIDELAIALDLDPLELRMRNYAKIDLEEHKPWSSKSLDTCYRLAAEKFGWSRRSRPPRSMRDGRWLVGWGMATATYPAHQWKSSALARMHPDGSVLVLAGTQDIGTGTYTVMTQVAATALGVPIEKVTFDLGDTGYPETPLSAGSGTVSSTGSAVDAAARALRSRLVEMARTDARSPLHGVAAADIDAEDGRLVSKHDRSKTDAYADVVARSQKNEIEERAESNEAPDRDKHSCHSFGAQFVEVKVDESLGIVRVSRVVSAFAAGRLLNEKTARSQLLGGIVWGIGLALLEETVRDERTGRLVTRDLSDYHVPTNADVPDVEAILVPERDDWVNPIGAKGIGEIGIVGMGAAIANAVHHATGVRVRDLPIRVDSLLGGAR
ncbi:MAG TPA: xanthine dehydrogenase family protein molybdopterin-binding subunit [Polyangiaceae bacterium]|jgi:xanthine dehydrogenase YagR molybdenum-binding subunit